MEADRECPTGLPEAVSKERLQQRLRERQQQARSGKAPKPTAAGKDGGIGGSGIGSTSARAGKVGASELEQLATEMKVLCKLVSQPETIESIAAIGGGGFAIGLTAGLLSLREPPPDPPPAGAAPAGAADPLSRDPAAIAATAAAMLPSALQAAVQFTQQLVAVLRTSHGHGGARSRGGPHVTTEFSRISATAGKPPSTSLSSEGASSSTNSGHKDADGDLGPNGSRSAGGDVSGGSGVDGRAGNVITSEADNEQRGTFDILSEDSGNDKKGDHQQGEHNKWDHKQGDYKQRKRQAEAMFTLVYALMDTIADVRFTGAHEWHLFAAAAPIGSSMAATLITLAEGLVEVRALGSTAADAPNTGSMLVTQQA